MTTTFNQRKTIEAMLNYGGDFAAQLGEALHNTDNGVPCVIELAKCLSSADRVNRVGILRLLAQAGRILEMNQADRITLIVDEFPKQWAEAAKLAQVP